MKKRLPISLLLSVLIFVGSLMPAKALQAIEITLPNVTTTEHVPVPAETRPTVEVDPAEADTVTTPQGRATVVDQADLFTPAEEETLGREAARLGRQYTMDLVIVTTEDAEGKSSAAYADDFFDYNGYGADEQASGVLFLIDMDNREFYISTTGEGIRYYTDVRVEGSLDAIEPYMLEGEFAGATEAFLSSTAGWLAAGIPSNQTTVESAPRVFRLDPLEILIAVVLAVVAMVLFIVLRRNVYKAKQRGPVYDARKGVVPEYTTFKDTVVNRYVTQRYIPPVTTSGGTFGSGGGSSGVSSTHFGSSGRSHGGGGRGF